MTRLVFNAIILTVAFYAVTIIGNVVRAEQLSFRWSVEDSCAISVPPSVDFGTISLTEIQNTTGYMADYIKMVRVSVSCSFIPVQYKITLAGSTPVIMGPDGTGCLPMTGENTNFEPALGVCMFQDEKGLDLSDSQNTYKPTSALTEHNFEVKLMANGQHNVIAQKVFATLNITLDVQ
ncbi:fimbrial protein [Enterobacter hormaechei subsp. xiangfangensis]